MDKPLAVTGAIIGNNGRIFIAKRPAGSHLAGMWELPGGKAEVGESLQDCLCRELREELSILVKNRNLRYFDEAFYEYGYKRIRLVCFTVGTYVGNLRLNEHADGTWAKISALNKYNFAPADVPIIGRIQRYSAMESWGPHPESMKSAAAPAFV